VSSESSCAVRLARHSQNAWARHVERVKSCRVESSQVEFGLIAMGQNGSRNTGLVLHYSLYPADFCCLMHIRCAYMQVPHDHLAYRYEVLKVIGKGSFGQVVHAFDHKKGVNVALKMVRNEKRFHRQAQEEIHILEHLRRADVDNSWNVVILLEHFTFRNHICITFELLAMNLYELSKKNKFRGFSLGLVRKFAHSMLKCLLLLYDHRIIHCDMKPENVLLKTPGHSGIKVSYQQATDDVHKVLDRQATCLVCLSYTLAWSLGPHCSIVHSQTYGYLSSCSASSAYNLQCQACIV